MLEMTKRSRRVRDAEPAPAVNPEAPPEPMVREGLLTREELRALVLEALRCGAEGVALAPRTRGTHTLPDGTVIRRN